MKMKRNQINVRENRRNGQEWTIQRHMNDWVHKTRVLAKLILPYAYILNPESSKWEQIVKFRFYPIKPIVNFQVYVKV
jgi:fructose-bisphosphate aldolase class 1